MKALFFIIPLVLSAGLTSCSGDEQQSGLFVYTGREGEQKRVRNYTDWEQKRSQILEGMQQAMGRLPERHTLSAPDIEITDSLKEEGYTRLTIRFPVAENEMVPAYLYIPFQKGHAGPMPAVLVLHGTGNAGKRLVDGESPLDNRAHAKELARRGYVVIAPDYPTMGELRDYDLENDRYQSGTMKAIVNNMGCIDLLHLLEYVDTARIGAIGHSLGGHNAMFTGAFDKRIKVVVSSCGWTLMDYYDIGEEASEKYGGRLGPWAQDRYMPLIRDKYDLDPAKIPFDFQEVIAALAPRAFFSSSPLNDGNFDVKGVEKGIAEASEVYRFLHARDRIQVRYPDAGHDFPKDVRLEAYRFIDRIFNHVPERDIIY